MIRLTVGQDGLVPLEVSQDGPVEMAADDRMFVDVGTSDYEQLKNLPKLDGRPIVGDIPELDPTVPEWAKAATPPEYTAEDVGAIPDGAIKVLDDGDFEEMWEST